jgi:hypothetical protein
VAATPGDGKKTPLNAENSIEDAAMTPLPFTNESEVLLDGAFSDDKSRLKSLSQIQTELKE